MALHEEHIGGEHSHNLKHNHDGTESHTHSDNLILNALSHDLIWHSHSHSLTHDHDGTGSHTHNATHSHAIGGGEHPIVFNNINHTKDELKSIQTGIPIKSESVSVVGRKTIQIPKTSEPNTQVGYTEPSNTIIVSYSYENKIVYLTIKRVSGGYALANSFVYVNGIGKRTPGFFYGRIQLAVGKTLKIGITGDFEKYKSLMLVGIYDYWREDSEGIHILYIHEMMFSEDDFTIELQGAGGQQILGTATQADFDADGNLIQNTPASPTNPYRSNLVDMWAVLKKVK